MNQVIHGDNLEILPTLPGGAARLAYIDPPFNTGRRQKRRQMRVVADENGDRTGFAGRRYRTEVTGERSYADEYDAYLDFLMPRIEAALPCLTDDASLFVHLDWREVHYVKIALDRLLGRDHFMNEIVWAYDYGGRSKRRWPAKHDSILWYGRTADYAFYPDAVRVPRKPNSHMRVVRDEDGQLVQEKTDRKPGKVYRYPVSTGKVPEDWWIDIETLNRGDRERTGYPTQKPERLLERVIRAASAEGALVGDWFCGSGTTAVVAQRLNRRFIAIDSQPDAIETARVRIETAGRELRANGKAPPKLIVDYWINNTGHSGASPSSPSSPLGSVSSSASS